MKEGRWEPEGAMWVEADCNLTAGESLVRQILYGKHFFRDEFGVESHILWLPDVFGYSAAMPQILKKCGVDWFVTSKISWNDTNQMPPERYSLVSVSRENIICETVKEAENGHDTVLRLYESKNMKCTADITVGFAAGSCFLCDMLENELQEIPLRDNCVRVSFGAFEIVTLKFKA